MKIPKKVQIFGKSFKVDLVDQLLWHNIQPVSGMFIPDSSQIFIDKHQKPDQLMHTLLHEMGHALINRVSIHQTGMPPEVEEMLVDSYATMITESFKLQLRSLQK